MNRKVTFFLALAYLVVVLLIGGLYFFTPWLRGMLPDTLGPVPLGVPWFGALGAVLISLGGVFDHAHDWDDTLWPWHAARPLVGASLGVVSVLILQAGILAVGSDPTPTQPALTAPAVTPAPSGLPPTAPVAAAPGQPTPVPPNLPYYLSAFLVGYREETFRAMIKRLTDVVLSPGDGGGPGPTISAATPARAAHDVSTSVVVVGSGLASTQAVKFGAVAATRYTVDADGQLTVQTPIMAQPSTVAIFVTTRNGSATFYPFEFA
jgi:hypothetical protein